MRANDSLHEVLANAGLSPRRSWVHASTEIFEGEVADQLDAPQSGLGWYIESLNADDGTLRQVSLMQRWLRADAVRVTFDSAVSSRVSR